jgi:hypothetical protein
MAELLIDPNIRGWVFLPIVVITFLVGIIRHYVSMLISSQKKVEITQIQDRYMNYFFLIQKLNAICYFKPSNDSCTFTS